MTRIVLDRSIFHRSRFEKLVQSKLAELRAKGVVEVMFTANFLEETARYSQLSPDVFAAHWRFLRSLHVSRWFKHPDAVVPLELSGRQLPTDYIFHSSEEIENAADNFDAMADGRFANELLKDALLKTEQNMTFLERYRDEVLKARRETPRSKFTFEEFFEANVERWITGGFMQRYEHSEGFLDVWRSRRKSCPLTELFLRGWLATIFIPLHNHSASVDRNDRSDSEQIICLGWADVFVSDDRRFVKEAIGLLFPSSDKVLVESENLDKFLNSL